MNGRIYDPVLRTFLSADNLISNPENSQNYNRYAYALNNPLLYVDYDGNEPISLGLAVIIGTIIAITTYTAFAYHYGNFTWDGLIKNAIIGAASSVITFGIGQVATTIMQGSTTFAAQLARGTFQAVTHGFTQGVIAGVSGGSFEQGFLAGALSSVASSLYGADFNGNKGTDLGWGGNFRSSDVGQVLFGTASGGVGSALAGGNFWEGAAIGLTVSLLNHTFHKNKDGSYPAPARILSCGSLFIAKFCIFVKFYKYLL